MNTGQPFQQAARPVGVYDSGYGGLTVLRQLRQLLPALDYIYLGDSGRAPYGGRDVDALLDFSEQCVERLFDEGCRVIVVACHTISCVALRHLQQRYGIEERRVLGVTIPAAEAAVAMTRGHIGFLGTARTVASHTFRTEVRKLNAAASVSEVAASLLAPIVEEAWEETEIARMAVKRYVSSFSGIDTLVLGCTHYPLLERAFIELTPEGVEVLNPARHVALRFADWRNRHPEFAPDGSGTLRILSSGDSTLFAAHGARFLGERLPTVEHVGQKNGRLLPCPDGDEPMGQVMRTISFPSP